MGIETLGELRHACTLCGGSCQGTFVALFPGEEERVRHVAALLEVDDPVVAGRLRLTRGQCVFLGDDRLCRIHKEFGAASKPTVCRQFPVVATRVGSDIRVGLDPGCYTSVGSWRDGPLLEDADLVASSVPIGDREGPVEERLLALFEIPDLRVAQAVGALVAESPPEGGGLPPKFASRVATRIRDADLGPLLADPDTAPMIRRSLSPLLAARQAWDPTNPPAWPAISIDAERFALDAVRRMIFLRLASNLPSVATTALLSFVGVIATGWATDDDAAFGQAMAAWVRAIRADVFWRAIVPDAATLGWLGYGDRS